MPSDWKRLRNTRDGSMALALSDAISIENFLNPQIAISSGSNKNLLFSRLCEFHFRTLPNIKVVFSKVGHLAHVCFLTLAVIISNFDN